MSSAPDRLTILHVSEVHWGGVITLLDHFTRQQVAAGHQVHVLAPEPVGDALADGVDFHRWAVRRGRPHGYPRAVSQLRRLVAELRPDVIHLHSFFAGLLGRLPGALGPEPPPVVYQPHAWSDHLFRQEPLNALVRRLERRGARRTDVLVTNCRDEIDRGAGFGVRLPSFPLGVTVDGDRFRPPTAEERAAARAELGLNDERMLLVLGRLAWQKGQDLLLPVWERRHPEGAVLALVGPGETEELAPLAPTQWGHSVRAPGGVADVLPWLWASDLLVLSSRYETVGLVVAEAMATGLPVVATEVDGVREVVEDPPGDAAGAVVGAEDVEALLDAAVTRLNDPALVEGERAAALSRARTLFAPPVVAARLEEAYRAARDLRAHPHSTAQPTTTEENP
ncbi:glycosyltransferase [Nocardioides sp.]|uniref:glycosyltransferase n=1 Tax=Nocardioides sp. TaxID=35761 RepID=UPI003527477F